MVVVHRNLPWYKSKESPKKQIQVCDITIIININYIYVNIEMEIPLIQLKWGEDYFYLIQVFSHQT